MSYAISFTCVRSNAYNRISEMGDNHTFDDSGLTECYPSGFDVHLSAEEIQSWSEEKGWERIQTLDCCINARK